MTEQTTHQKAAGMLRQTLRSNPQLAPTPGEEPKPADPAPADPAPADPAPAPAAPN